MISTNRLEQAKNFIKKEKQENKVVIVKAQDDEFNRKILEYGKFDILLSPEAGKAKSSFKRISSGLNHVSAKIAAKNGIAIGIDIEELSNLSDGQKAERLAKIIQNIMLCRKAKAKIKVLGFKNEKNAFGLLVSLGASSQQAKEAF